MRKNLEKVYRRHRQGLYTLSLSITRCAAPAEDAVHEAFERLWRSGARPQGDVVAYVFAAVRNAAIKQCRDRRRELTGQDPPESIYENREPDPASAAIAAEQSDAIRRAVENLPDRQREVVVMKIHGGLRFAQIAEALAEPVPTITSRYRRALERLRDQLKRQTQNGR